ncbi:MAG: carboxypeptidase regulatory-like domain-containing protein [Acidobacteria bacterium]|nr:carboxypeptidase regulatory-like domain-containing protein [Acidobacteriota bacterium]
MFYRKSPALACAFALLLVTFAPPRSAAAAGGEIAGTITDPKGAVVVGAQVTAVEAATGKTAQGLTDGQGNFKLAGLPAGTYTVVVAAPGFAGLRREGVRVEEGKTARADAQLTVEYAGGDAILDLGGGNFYLGPRSTWYPNNYGTQFGDRAAFDIAFRYAKSKTLIGTGALAGPLEKDGDLTLAKWSSGGLELAVSGFNIGQFKTKSVKDAATGYDIEFYANNELPYFMQGANQLGSMSTTGMADSAIADAQNSTRIFDVYFGKLPYTRVAMTQQPAGNFGQAWPTLVYMPFTAFMDSTQRYMAGGIRAATADFFKYVGPHEVAHQWWGHTVGWTSYRDQWMSEGFAQFSTSLYSGNKTVEIKNIKLPAVPKRVVVGALQDVLALDSDNVKSK